MSIYQVVIKARLGTSNQQRNIRHYEFPGYDPDDDEKQEFVDNLDDDLKTYLQGHFHSGITVYSYGLRRVDVGEQPEAEIVPTAGAWAGASISEWLPAQTCLLVTWKAFASFPRTARNYLFTMSEAENASSGSPGATVLAAALGYADDSMSITVTGQTPATAVAVEYSGDPRVVSTYHELTAVATASFWATQRRRRPGVGI